MKQSDEVATRFKLLFESDDPEYESLRTGCLIQRTGDFTYSFLHKSYGEYFVATRLREEINQNRIDALNKVLIIQESEVISFLTKMATLNKTQLLDIVKRSKNDPSVKLASSQC